MFLAVTYNFIVKRLLFFFFLLFLLLEYGKRSIELIILTSMILRINCFWLLLSLYILGKETSGREIEKREGICL